MSNEFVTLNEILTQTIAWSEAIDVISDNSNKIKDLKLKSYQ